MTIYEKLDGAHKLLKTISNPIVDLVGRRNAMEEKKFKNT
jgi:hypothetical protein